MMHIEKIYVAIATVLVVFSVFFFVAQEQESRNFDDFALLKQRALHLYDDIISFARNSDQNDRLTVLIDENTQIQNNRIITQNPETGEQESYELNLFVQGTSCVGENEIVRLTEGIALCCGQCDNDVRLQFPSNVMCSPRQDVWLSCANFPRGNLGRVSLRCDDVSGSSATLLNDQNEIVASVSNPSAQWEDYLIFSFNQQVDVGDYVLELHCGADPTFQQLRVRIPSAGGGGGGGSRAPRNDSVIPPASVPQCNDGIDNDGDGRIDYVSQDTNGDSIIDAFADLECSSAQENSESEGAYCGFIYDIVGTGTNLINTSNFSSVHRGNFYSFYSQYFGEYPDIRTNSTGAITQIHYGGIPQVANMTRHLAGVRGNVTDRIPANAYGYAMIDYESWWPSWNRTGRWYKEFSINYTRDRHPEITDPVLLNLTAVIEYEQAARVFMEQTILEAKRTRPNIKWGYYALPNRNYWLTPLNELCPNPTYSVGYNDCLRNDNNKLDWLWNATDVLYPSVYQVYITNTSSGTWLNTINENDQYIRSNVQEAVRVGSRVGYRPVFAYTAHDYHDSINRTRLYQVNDCSERLQMSVQNCTLLNGFNLQQSYRVPLDAGADGVILWGYVSSGAQATLVNAYMNLMQGPVMDAAYRTYCGSLTSNFVQTQCSDNIDNDGDFMIDLFDSDCINGADVNEGTPLAECNDGLDNDGDGTVDFGNDAGCASSSDDDEYNIPANLLARYTFDAATYNDGARSYTDLSGNGNTLYLNENATPGAQGIANTQALYFNGNGALANTQGLNDLFDVEYNNFTILLWLKPSRYEETNIAMSVNVFQPPGYSVSSYNAYGLGFFRGAIFGTEHGPLQQSPATRARYDILKSQNPENEWIHVAFSRDQRNLSLYINGQLYHSMAAQPLNLSTPWNPMLVFGAIIVSPTQRYSFYNGTVDEFIFVNGSLSAEMINRTYEQYGVTTPESACRPFTFNWMVASQHFDRDWNFKDTYGTNYGIRVSTGTNPRNFIAAHQNDYNGYPHFAYFPGTYTPNINDPQNGGIPQRMNLQAQFDNLTQYMNVGGYVQSADWDGYAALDYELWPMLWEQLNLYGTNVYVQDSLAFARETCPTCDDEQILALAKEQWENATKLFYNETLRHARQLRPNAKWGMYAVPADLPQRGLSYGGYNQSTMRRWNEETFWFTSQLDWIGPSIYVLTKGDTHEQAEFNKQEIYNLMKETVWLADQVELQTGSRPEILPWTWHRYLDIGNLPYRAQIIDVPQDLLIQYQVPYTLGADGVLMWGYEPTVQNVTDFRNYMTSTAGPMIQEFIQESTCP